METAKNGLLILSGGMDSVTLLHEFQKEIKMAISFNYGQKHLKELIFAKQNCDELGIVHHIIDLSGIGNFLKSDLLKSGGEIPEGHYEDISMQKTVVPFRNGIMLAVAAGIAESNDCQKLFIANHRGDHAIYPDCRNEFIISMRDAIIHGTYKNIVLCAPYTTISKRDIALKGKAVGVDFSKTWSCYKGGEIHCGKCGTCTERKEALEGFDSTVYEEENGRS